MKQEPGVFVKKCFKYHREAAEEQDLFEFQMPYRSAGIERVLNVKGRKMRTEQYPYRNGNREVRLKENSRPGAGKPEYGVFKRAAAVLLAVLVTAGALAGCGGSSSGGTAAGSSAALRRWSHRGRLPGWRRKPRGRYTGFRIPIRRDVLFLLR